MVNKLLMIFLFLSCQRALFSEQSDIFLFPANFGFGTATSAHQVEGNNCKNDWWKWENDKHFINIITDKSLMACDMFNRYPEDFALMKELGLKSYRFSIEWSRIEPEKDQIDKAALEVYRKMLETLKKYGIKPSVTLVHFTLPHWLTDFEDKRNSGWLREETLTEFYDFVKLMMTSYGDLVDEWVIFNEPNMYIMNLAIMGIFPGGTFLQNSLRKQLDKNIIEAHKNAFDIIRAMDTVDSDGDGFNSFIGIAGHFIRYKPNLFDIAKFGEKFGEYFNFNIVDALVLDKTKRYLDFVGINYYKSQESGIVGYVKEMLLKDKADRSDLGWKIDPNGLEIILKEVYDRYNLPIIITENGISTKDDNKRIDYLESHLAAIARALKNNIPVLGYYHWSFIDNWEWNLGYGPKFGLVELNFETQKRTPKKSAYIYRDIISKGLSLQK